MKSGYKFLIIAAAAAMLAVGCDDAKYDVINNSIYLSDAAGTEKITNIAFNETSGAAFNVPVRIAKLLDYDLEYRIELAPDALEEYNRYYDARLNCVDPQYLTFENQKGLIEAGTTSAMSSVKVASFDTEQKAFAVPIRVVPLNDDIESSEAQGVFMYVLAKKLENIYSPKFKYSGGDGTDRITAKPDPADGQGWNMFLPEWTLECWCRFDGYTMNNQAIFDVTGIDQGFGNYGIYVRFGDANSPYNYLQWKAWGAQLEGERDLEANVWYHWAFQYDGANIVVFRNGIEYLRGTIATAGEPWMIDRFRMIGAHQNWQNNANMSQVRLWKKALTPGQIANNMYYELDAGHPDLVAFWRMEEGAANFNGEFIDATGNGHDLVVPFFGASNCPVVGWDGPFSFGD